MDNWTVQDVQDHLANQAQLIETTGSIEAAVINTNAMEYRQVQTLAAILFIVCVWVGYVISVHFVPTKRDIAG